jgi:hypothetical protein
VSHAELWGLERGLEIDFSTRNGSTYRVSRNPLPGAPYLVVRLVQHEGPKTVTGDRWEATDLEHNQYGLVITCAPNERGVVHTIQTTPIVVVERHKPTVKGKEP